MSYSYYDYAVLGDACTPQSMAILNNTKFLEPNSEVYKIYYTQMYNEPASMKSYEGQYKSEQWVNSKYNMRGGCNSCNLR